MRVNWALLMARVASPARSSHSSGVGVGDGVGVGEHVEGEHQAIWISVMAPAFLILMKSPSLPASMVFW